MKESIDKDKNQEMKAEDAARQAREEIAEWIRSGNGPKVDLKAAEEVKHLGLEANYDRLAEAGTL